MTGKTFDSPWMEGFGYHPQLERLPAFSSVQLDGETIRDENDRFFEESNGLYTVYNQSRRLLYDRWKKPGDLTDIPRYGEVAHSLYDRFLENASFMRLKNLSLAYTLPQSLLKKSKFFTLGTSVYTGKIERWTITGFNGLDPEVAANVYQAQYPATRQFTFGADYILNKNKNEN